MGWIADLLSEIPSAARYKIQLEQLEADHRSLKTENETLKEKIITCQKNLDQANEEIRNLNLLIERLKGQDQKKYKPETEKILRHFFDAGRELPMNQFLSIVSQNASILQYHFDLLIKDNLIWRSTEGQQSSWARVDEPDLYSLTPTGREYVIKNMDI